MEFLNELTTINWTLAIITSLFTSLLFLFLLSTIRPIIRISNYILKGNNNKTDKIMFKIKVVNWTGFNLYNVQAELVLVERYGDGNSTYSVRNKELKLATNSLIFMPGMISKKGQKDAKFAQIFHTYEDLNEIWTKDSQYLEFRLLARHGLSSYFKLHVKQYTDRNYIKTGNFKYGISMKQKQ